MQFSAAQHSWKRFGKPRLTGSAIGLASAAGAWVLYTFPPAAYSFYPPCIFHAATGLLCPGCGTTRALHQLLHGNVAEAFRLNPFLFVLMLGALVAAPSLVRGETPSWVMKSWFGWTSLAVVLGWFVLRNVW